MPEPIIIGDSIGAASVRTATGAMLLTTPFWAEILYTVNVVAATIASVCGAIIGLTGVWRLVMRRGRRS